MASSRKIFRVRKRTFIVTGLTLLAILLIGSMSSYLVSTLLGPADMVRLTVNESQSRLAVLGSGISLSQAETSNLLADESFEPLVFRQTLTIYNGDATTLTVSSEDASAGQYGDGFFNDADARVMTQTADGLVLKKTARVLQYGINRVGVFQDVNLPGDAPSDQAVLAFVRKGEVSLAVGEGGLIIRNVTSQMPAIAESGVTSDLTGICAFETGYLACSSAGDLIFSADTETWQTWPTFGNKPLQAIAANADGLYVAVGENGAIIAGQDGPGTFVKTGTTADLTDIAYGGSTFVAAGSDGTILVSRTGLLWQTVNLSKTINWQAADYRDGRFVLVGDNGAIAISDNGRDFSLLSHEGKQDYVDIVMLSRQQLIVLDHDGNFSVSNDSGANWLQSGIDTGMKSRVISLAGKDKILSADTGESLGIAQLVAEIQLDSPLKEGQYQAGDILYLEKAATFVPQSYLAADAQDENYQDSWEIFGSGTSQRVTDEAAPGGGDGAMLLQAAAAAADLQAPAIISQVVDPAKFSLDQQNEVYQIELWMKQDGIADRSAQVWLTGPFETIGTTFTNVGATWKKYSYTFIMPIRTSGLEGHEIRLNIAANSGSLWIDRVGLSRAVDSTDLLSSDFQSVIQSTQPQTIRLAYLSIGGPDVREESWALAEGNGAPYLSDQGWTSQPGGSLHAALSLVQSSGADPWLVIDSYTSEAELLDLIEYLAGPISEPYGKIRMDLGAVAPWTDQFDRIMIELADTAGILQTDRLKADFVDLMIQTISQSPYYRQIKGELIFIDGMTYHDGVMLSTADYHASDLDGLIQTDRSQTLIDAFIDYYDQIPRNPEKSIQNWPELMRTAQLRPNGTNLPQLADLTEILLRDLGDQTNLSNLNLPGRSSPDWQETLPAAAFIASACAEGVPLEIAGASEYIRAHGFKSSRQIAIALTNFSDSTATCQLITDLPLNQAVLYRYDAKGQLISKQPLKASNNKLTILPGGVILVIKDLSES